MTSAPGGDFWRRSGELGEPSGCARRRIEPGFVRRAGYGEAVAADEHARAESISP